MARITPETPQRGSARNLLNVVDNYYQPARDRMGEAAIAKGFDAASNVASTLSRKAINEDIKEAKIKAQADAMQEMDPDKELSEVRLGNLFRPQSKAYNQVYNETMGKKAAIEFQENATLEYEKSGLKRNTDPNKFREWMNGRVHEFLKAPENQNEYFLVGAMPYVQQTTFNMGAAHMRNVSAQMERNHLASIQKQADAFAMGIANGDMTIEDGLAKMTQLNSQAYGTGISGPKARSAMLSSYLTVADATDNKEMVTALLEAQENGTLQLTPKEWNEVTNQGMAIERDINFRQAQQQRAQEAQKKQEIGAITEGITDFYNNPANAGVPFQTFLNQPVGEQGQTMAEMINASSNSTEILAKAKSAYETVNTIYEIPKSQELGNNSVITQAMDSGDITDTPSLMAFMQKAVGDGYRFNDQNWTHAYSELEKFNDPEAPYQTQTYKDFKKASLNRAINAMTPEGSSLITSFDGSYQGEMADDIRIRFQGYLDDNLAGVGNNPEAVKKAILAAEQSVMDFYRENDPALFGKQFNSFMDAVEEGTVSWTSNPSFAREAARLAEEQQALLAQEAQKMAQNRADGIIDNRFDRSDLQLQMGADILFGTGDAQNNKTSALPEDPAAQAVAAQVATAEAEQAERVAQIEADRVAEQSRQAAERQAKLDADAALMSEAKNVAERLNELNLNETSPEEFSTLLSDIQQEFNLTLPTNYDELKFLAEDLTALQEETGVKINQEVLAKLLQAAMDRF